MTDEPLLPLHGEEDAGGFDVVLRGFDRRQVDDYVERVEVALAEADRLHLEDGERMAALEQELLHVRSRLTDAEQRAAGLPEPASRLTERLATMLRLAEEEAEQIVGQARDRADRAVADRTADLDRRETEVQEAHAQAEALRLDAQRDADTMRTRTREESQKLFADAKAEADAVVAAARAQADSLLGSVTEEADRKRRTAEEDVAILHEDARAHAHQLVEDAQRQVAELAHQRDLIAAQLQQLRETLAAAVQPLNPPPA